MFNWFVSNKKADPQGESAFLMILMFTYFATLLKSASSAYWANSISFAA